MSYPILYKANETDFSTLGLGVLSDATSALVTEERNGQFYLIMQYPIDGIRFNELKNDRVIKVDASNNLKDQRFKIERITKPSKGIVTVYANHVSYHSEELQLRPDVSYNGNAQSALTTWRNNLVESHPFTVYSDIQTEGSGRWSIDKVENARRALGGVQGSILDSYGGEYRFDNYHIGLYAQRGNESGALIAYGKNLIELEQEEEIASTHTSVYPYSIIANDDGEEELITLPEYFIDSEYVGNYARRKILTIDFSDEDIKTADGLRTRVRRYIKENNIGVPRVNLRVKFIDLSKTLDYKHLKLIEEINLCDWVNIYFEKLDIVRKAKIIAATWDVLLERYHEIEVGESRASLSRNIDTTIERRLDPVSTRLNIIQTAANGKNSVFRGPTEPLARKVGDLWYKPVGDGEMEMYQWNGTIWELVVSTAVNSEIDTRIEDAKGIAENARDEATNASNRVQKAIDDAKTAYDYADSAIRAANGKNTVYRGGSQPSEGEENDIWFQTIIEDGKEVTKMYVHDGANWVLRAYDASELAGTLDLSQLNVINLNMDSATGGSLHLDRGLKVTNNDKDVLKVENGNVVMDVDNLLIQSQGLDEVMSTSFYQDGLAIGMMYEENGEIKSIFNLGPNGPYLSGKNIVLNGDTIVDGTFTVTDEIFAENMSISKFTAGTLNAANVNLINVNVSSLVGNTSEFIRSGWNAINSRADMNGSRLRFTHNDGTSTEIGASGIRRVTPSDNRAYHYLIYATTFIRGVSSSNAHWIQLPDDFKGKDFKVYMAVADSMNVLNYRRAIQRFVCTIHPNHNIDYARARVPIIGYKSETLSDGEAPEITSVQGLLWAIY